MRRSSPASTPSPADGSASIDPDSSAARALFHDDAQPSGTNKRRTLLTRPRPFMNGDRGHRTAHSSPKLVLGRRDCRYCPSEPFESNEVPARTMQSMKGSKVLLGALIGVACPAGCSSSTTNASNSTTASQPSSTSGISRHAPTTPRIARPTVAPCISSMTAIAHGIFAYAEPGHLFTPATGAPTPQAALQEMKKIGPDGLIAACPYINSIAASQIVQVLGAIVGTPLPTAAIAQVLHGTKGAPGELLTINSLSCGVTSCSGKVTITNSTGGSSAGTVGTTRFNLRWFVTAYMTTTASN